MKTTTSRCKRILHQNMCANFMEIEELIELVQPKIYAILHHQCWRLSNKYVQYILRRRALNCTGLLFSKLSFIKINTTLLKCRAPFLKKEHMAYCQPLFSTRAHKGSMLKEH